MNAIEKLWKKMDDEKFNWLDLDQEFEHPNEKYFDQKSVPSNKKSQPAPKYITIDKPDKIKYDGRKKSHPWTSAPSCRNAQGSTPAIIIDEFSGGLYSENGDGYDPQPKSLGRWVGNGDDAERFYSKQTSDVDKSANVQNIKYLQIPDGESYIPEQKSGRYSENGTGKLGLEILEQSYAWLDEDGNQCYNPRWKPRLTKQEIEQRRRR